VTLKENPSYKWAVLTLAALTFTFAVAMPTMAMPVLFKEISEDLGLNLVQVGAVWGTTALAAMFSGMISGSIGDRFGARRTLSVACALAGAGCALRGMSDSFLTLSLTVLLSGFLMMAIPTNVHKICGIWFSRRRLGLANGIVSMGMALGFMTSSMISATWISPWLGGWRNVLFFYGALAVAISIPWHFVRDAPVEVGSPGKSGPTTSVDKPISQVARIRGVWILGIGMLCLGGSVQGTLGYLPLYLRNVGWDPAAADNALATFHAMSMTFVVPITWLSDRWGVRKPFLLTAALMITLGIGLLSVVSGFMVWVSVIAAGMFRDAFMAILMTTIIEVQGVGAALAGSAVGLVMAFSQLGSFLSPLAGNSLAALSPNAPFVLWAILALASVISFSRIREGAVDEEESVLVASRR
jgi:NNP family nitrate/nitrite transporter-like MFS transporter